MIQYLAKGGESPNKNYLKRIVIQVINPVFLLLCSLPVYQHQLVLVPDSRGKVKAEGKLCSDLATQSTIPE
jgi:hypothetical protein